MIVDASMIFSKQISPPFQFNFDPLPGRTRTATSAQQHLPGRTRTAT